MTGALSESPPIRSASRWLGSVASELWYFVWGRVILTPLCLIAFRLKIEGREHEPRHGPFIAAFNHTSAVDPVLAGVSLRRRAYFMAKAEVLSIPVVGPWVVSMGTFPVRRGEPDRKALRRAFQILEQGGVLVMFPEGTRSPDGRLQAAEPGAALIALRMGVPVLPVALVGSYRVLPKGARWPKFVPVRVRVGPLLNVPRVEGRLDHQVLDTWGRRIMQEIAKLLPPEQGGTSVELPHRQGAVP